MKHSGLLRRWDAYWNAVSDGWFYSVFRIIWIPVQIYFVATILFFLIREANVPPLPYPFFPFAAEIPFEVMIGLCVVSSLLIIAIAVGWQTRISQIIFALLAFPLFLHSATPYHNHLALFLVVNLFAAFAVTNRWYSLDARKKRSERAFDAWQSAPVPLLWQRLILLQASLLYLFSTIHKLSPQWFYRWSATPEPIMLMEEGMWKEGWLLLLQHDLAWVPVVIVIVLMFFVAAGIFVANRYPIIALIGLLLHLGFSMSIATSLIDAFTVIMMCILFLSLFPAKKGQVFYPPTVRKILGK